MAICKQQLRDGWIQLLGRKRWDWFVTLTFRDPPHPEKADKAFRYLVNEINKRLYGKRWYKKSRAGVIWARGLEYHKSGVIHFHALLAEPTRDLNDLLKRMYWVDWWYERFGIARVERVDSNEAVNRYVSKYISKDGEIDCSPNLVDLEEVPDLEVTTTATAA